MSVRFCIQYNQDTCPLECDWVECIEFDMDDLYKDKVIIK